MAFRLAHLSDPHLPPLPPPRLGELAGKRALGFLNWARNRHKYHRREVLDALLADLQAQSPDHIAVTGDLVNLALEAEFAPALNWLESLGPAQRVSVVPGNHDTYVKTTAHRHSEVWSSYLGGDDARQGFPALRRRGDVALICMSSAVPTAPFMATGRLGATQLQATARLLDQLSAERLFRVLLVHHPLRSTSRYKRLTDSAGLLALIRQYGVELILHGHDHVHSTVWFEGPQQEIPAIGVPSASALAHGDHPAAAYNLFDIERDGEGWRCEQVIRGMDGAMQVREIARTRLI